MPDFVKLKPEIVDLTNILEQNEPVLFQRDENTINSIVIHHDAIKQNGHLRIKDIVKYHLTERNYPSVAYHYYIDSEGTIYHLVASNIVTYHTIGANLNSLGICLNGNFNEEDPTELQKRSLKVLINWLKGQYNIQNVNLHRELNPETDCPGKNFKY